MALNNPANLFLYELAGMYDAEKKSRQLLGEAVGHVQDNNVAQMLRAQEQESQQKIGNLEACFQAFGVEPQGIPCATVDGMRAEFQAFASQQPSAEVFQMYALSAAMKLSHYGIASYRDLVDKAMLMGETECAQILQSNLVEKEESAGRLERVNHEMSQRVLTMI